LPYTSSHFATESFSAFTRAAVVPRDFSIAFTYPVLFPPATPPKKSCGPGRGFVASVATDRILDGKMDPVLALRDE
jgi:hypothetical protein